MECVAPFCKNNSNGVSSSEVRGISFHGFPSDKHLRAAWLKALGKQDTHLPDSAVVCSQHFFNKDIHVAEGGLKQIDPGVLPSAVLVCVICLDTDNELLLMSDNKEEYQLLTGQPLCDQGNLRQTLCMRCAQTLHSFSRFRKQSLRARRLLQDLVQKHGFVTRSHIQLIQRDVTLGLVTSSLGLDRCDARTERADDDTHTKSEHPDVDVKSEQDCSSVQEEMEVANEGGAHDDEAALSNNASDDSIARESKLLEEAISSALEKAGARLDAFLKCEKQTEEPDDKDAVGKLIEHQGATQSLVAVLSPTKKEADTAQKSERALASDSRPDGDDRASIRPCVVVLYDVLKAPSEAAPIQDGSRRAVSCDIARGGAVAAEPSAAANSGDARQRARADTTSEPYACDVCGRRSRYKSDLVTHRRTHTGEKPYACTMCSYRSGDKRTLVRHIRTHTGEKPYACTMCSYRSGDNGTLARHIRTHTGEKLYACSICSYKSGDKGALVKHLRTHTGEKPYACTICSYKANHRSHLVRHIRTHTGEKPYACTMCSYRSGDNGTLARHIRTHTGEKLYACSICSYKSGDKGALVKHLRTHTGEKPYACKHCEYKCAVKSSLNLHLLTHNGGS